MRLRNSGRAILLWLALLLPSFASAGNYQDLWWNPAESGWGVSISQQGDTLFAAWFLYDSAQKGTWFVMSNGAKTADGSYKGILYQTSGPAYNAAPYDPKKFVLTEIGNASFTFSDAHHGILNYTANGSNVSKAIQRISYAKPQLAGTYWVSGAGNALGCDGTQTPVPYKFSNGDYIISVSDDQLALDFRLYDTTNDWSVRSTCLSSGSFAQNGSLISFNAPFTCNDGSSGSLSLTNLSVDDAGFLGEAEWKGKTCVKKENVGGVRRSTANVTAAGTVQFSSASYSVAENAQAATISVTRTGGSSGKVSVSYATANGTASAGQDYATTLGTLSFADGDSAPKSFTIPLVDDTLVEGDETVLLTLSNPTGGATLGAPGSATLTITDNDTSGSSGEVTVKPSANPQTVKANGISVTIPGGLLTSDTTLKIVPSNKIASLPGQGGDTKILGAYDISLGNATKFSQKLTLEFPYSPGTLEADLPEGKNLWVSSWDENEKIWLITTATVDTTRKLIVVNTDHLSTWTYWTLQGYRYVAAGPIEVYYNPRHTQPRTDVAAGYAMQDFANDTLAALTTAYQAYATDGFIEPFSVTSPISPVKAIITDDGTAWSPYTGNIILDRRELTTQQLLRNDTGHELFHAFQNQYFNIFGMDHRRWWIEGTPDYASAVLAWNNQIPLPQMTPSYFTESLLLADNAHAYQNSHFVNYLVGRRNANFGDMWDAVAFNSSYGDNGLTALRTYVGRVAQSTFDLVWMDFVRYAMFGQNTLMDDVISTAFQLSDTLPSSNRTVQVANYAAQVVQVRALPPAGQQGRAVTVSASGLSGSTTLDVWKVSNRDRRGAQFLKTLVDGNISATVNLGANDSLFAVVMNTGSSERSVTVRADTLQLASLNPAQGAEGTSVTLTGSGFGLSADNRSVYFNGTRASSVNWVSETQLVTKVPEKATTGAVQIELNGVRSNGLPFTITPSNWKKVLVQLTIPVQSSGSCGERIMDLNADWDTKFPGCTASGSIDGAIAIGCEFLLANENQSSGELMRMSANIDGPSARLVTSTSGTGWSWSMKGRRVFDYLKSFTFATWYKPLKESCSYDLYTGSTPSSTGYEPKMEVWLEAR